MVFLWNFNGFHGYNYGCFLNGISMQFLYAGFRGLYIGFSMDFLQWIWQIQGTLDVFLNGISMDFTGISRGILRVFLWNVWDVHGISMGFSMGFSMFFFYA